MSDPAATANTKCDPTSYQYWIYGVLGALVVGSEVLGVTKRVAPNSIIQVVLRLIRGVIGKPEEPAKNQVAPDA